MISLETAKKIVELNAAIVRARDINLGENFDIAFVGVGARQWDNIRNACGWKNDDEARKAIGQCIRHTVNTRVEAMERQLASLQNREAQIDLEDAIESADTAGRRVL